MSPKLEYLPLSYRLYQPLWPTMAAVAALGAILAVGASFKIGWVHPFELGLIAMTGIFAAAAIVLYCLNSAYECRVEGGMLSFRALTLTRQLTQFPIADITQIDGVFNREYRWCEIAFHDGRRIRIAQGPLVNLAQSSLGSKKSHEKFKAAILAINSNVVFGKRDARFCHACGRQMKVNHFPESLCSECGAAKPTNFPQGA
ncbi:MAG TPA: hypothetical protein VFE47_03175 [Tepidisphaeraceae bacterium]|jgi:hypothetical protein|nr:hypothetical protein [Tepidisphaeraceae bacterium]